ncbi:NucA/NucB deoxyribonuclease domain-containing protein [Streptomyces olivochromogenes]|uniref:NucA/NucB deoxyribonuclease domain-containing protein n=1 Tax=Streptomyces olivochromogenes TaxID=1963 RepID=UPI001F18C0D2|nr:hypothetical protein [Streptomyces olivochromogenes]MCF3135580.1 hypothetical protein [Streptomyces olivochromogenes]
MAVTGLGSEPAAKPAENRDIQAAAENCSTPNADGAGACLRPIPASRQSTLLHGSPTPQAGVNPPQWCEDARGRILGTREAVCWVAGLSYETYRTVNGQRQTTGKAEMNVINYSYGDSGLPTWAYQIEVSAYSGWGDAMKASISGKATKSGACKVTESTFPSKKLAPLNSWKLGESFFDTTATRQGAIGHCATTWTLTFTNAPYTPATTTYKLNEFRCDNATAGRSRVGCVVPWYASALIYSKSRAPELASHITRAQNSGLPGATFKRPLTRTTNATTIARNRDRACPPRETRPHGKTCDEYPVATSKQGLSAGGERRSFPGCSIRGVPSRTGPKGASACMISEADQDYQGGKNSGFYKAERMLDGDPFRVLIGN